MNLDDDISRLKLQEQVLQFTKFGEADAWNLGQAMRNLATSRKLPVVIDIRILGRKLFYAALPGTVPDNEHWVRRKINVVMRYHKSSYHVGREIAKSGNLLDESRGVRPIDVAPHGGCFPVIIKDLGVVGSITVSGIPQRDDHNFVIECIAAHLKIDYVSVALAAE